MIIKIIIQKFPLIRIWDMYSDGKGCLNGIKCIGILGGVAAHLSCLDISLDNSTLVASGFSIVFLFYVTKYFNQIIFVPFQLEDASELKLLKGLQLVDAKFEGNPVVAKIKDSYTR